MTSIILHLHEIRVILADRQTQLRRPVEPQPPAMLGPWCCPFGSKLHVDEFTLNVLAVRVEQVRDISELDAYAEGINMSPVMPHPKTWFRDLWDKLYPAHPWETSWCWVAKIERVK